MYKELYVQFSKKELLEIAEELDIGVAGLRTRVAVITEAIVSDLEDNGVPESEECSDLLFEFLYAAEFIDEDGNLLEEEEDVEEEEEDEEEELSKDQRPECFEYADDRDPACRKCAVYGLCFKARIATRPSCYGILFSAKSEECKVCMDAPTCKMETKERS